MSDRNARADLDDAGHDSGERDGGKGRGEGQGGGGTSRWEWVLAAFSALLVLGAIGYTLYEALGRPTTPPYIEVVVDGITPTPTGGYVVQFTARNRGYRTAAALMVEGELSADTGQVETAQATVSYVPAQGARGGGLVFQNDPRAYTLHVRPVGYERP